MFIGLKVLDTGGYKGINELKAFDINDNELTVGVTTTGVANGYSNVNLTDGDLNSQWKAGSEKPRLLVELPDTATYLKLTETNVESSKITQFAIESLSDNVTVPTASNDGDFVQVGVFNAPVFVAGNSFDIIYDDVNHIK